MHSVCRLSHLQIVATGKQMQGRQLPVQWLRFLRTVQEEGKAGFHKQEAGLYKKKVGFYKESLELNRENEYF